jgi:hypothetical protein
LFIWEHKIICGMKCIEPPLPPDLPPFMSCVILLFLPVLEIKSINIMAV